MLLADDLEEAEETFRVTLETPEGAVLGGLTSAVVTLRDAGRGEVGGPGWWREGCVCVYVCVCVFQ